jgi:hypothetical protein
MRRNKRNKIGHVTRSYCKIVSKFRYLETILTNQYTIHEGLKHINPYPANVENMVSS